MKIISKIIVMVLIGLFMFNSGIVFARNPVAWKDIILVTPLSDDANWCYTAGEGNAAPDFIPLEGGKCKWKSIRVQVLEYQEENDGLTASKLINSYVWKLLAIVIKLWVLLAIWAIVFGWIMVSTAWDENKLESWKEKIIWWIIAFLIIVMAWVILNTINPLVFVWWI